jgi:hypothetical protein
VPAPRSIPQHLRLTQTPLPAPDLALAAHAHDVAELGAWLIASGKASLLSVVLSPNERDSDMPITLWSASVPDARLSRVVASSDYPFHAVTRALEKAADGLWQALRPRWPASMPPRRLGVVTDGNGVGFCPDDPCPLAPGWLSRRARDRASLTCLLPFAAHGGWTALTGSPN